MFVEHMFLAHFAAGFAARQFAPRVSLGTWFAAAQFVDLLWPICLLLGLENVRIAPGITAFTPLDFYDYPITHSLVGGIFWAALFAGVWWFRQGAVSTAYLIAATVLSHWVLDVISHRPDVPVLPRGPYLGLGLWYSVPATLIVEFGSFAVGGWLYARGHLRGTHWSFWLLVMFLVIVFLAASFGPPPPNTRTLAWSAMSAWLLIPWAWYTDRATQRRAEP